MGGLAREGVLKWELGLRPEPASPGRLPYDRCSRLYTGHEYVNIKYDAQGPFSGVGGPYQTGGLAGSWRSASVLAEEHTSFSHFPI